ncbi:Terpenoid cyclases/protein prenyltransferase alpha-alpha toroid [Penicillium longicatenatum]|nr:Terpenoid cyclases/protein prenyltransferase alpha-alpha toroid [Penicillium longicatenatum]
MDSAVLQCTICPRQPRFSDISHLLTHVASKAHLSYYFKLQVRSVGEAQANELLAKYDDWYGTNGLAQLLSDRMTSKEDRKQKKKSQLKKAVDSKIQHTQRRSRRSNSKGYFSPEVPAFPDFLDPRLVDSPERVKRSSSIQDSSLDPIYATPATTAVADANVVQMKTDFGLVSTPPMRTVTHEGHGHKHGYAEMSYAILPETPKRFLTRGRPSAISLAVGRNIPDPFMDEMHTEVSEEIDADKERADEMARLKGILWPGMDIFDSATQQMRRKRNQKKDRSVLEMMELTSLQVEPTELIFSPTGVFRKQRVISGNVEDDTPLKGETPIPKRRISRPKRGVLRQADPNLPRAQDRKRAKKIVNNNRNRKDLETFDIDDRSPYHFTGGLKGLNSSYGDDSEIGLAVQAFGRRRGNGFTIFADGEGPETTFNDRSGHFTVPRDNLTPARLILNHKLDVNDHVAKPGQTARDKENIEPIMNAQGRIDFQDWHSPFPRQSNTDNAGYNPRYYYEEPPYGGLGPDGSDNAGHRSNPLLAPSSKLRFYEASPYGNDMTMNPSDWTITDVQHRAASSEATISEQDQRDLARLYLATNTE